MMGNSGIDNDCPNQCLNFASRKTAQPRFLFVCDRKFSRPLSRLGRHANALRRLNRKGSQTRLHKEHDDLSERIIFTTTQKNPKKYYFASVYTFVRLHFCFSSNSLLLSLPSTCSPTASSGNTTSRSCSAPLTCSLPFCVLLFSWVSPGFSFSVAFARRR